MNVPCTHTSCIQGDDFFFNTGYIPLIFGNKLRFKLTVAVSGNLHLEFAILAFECLLGMPIAFVIREKITLLIFS